LVRKSRKSSAFRYYSQYACEWEIKMKRPGFLTALVLAQALLISTATPTALADDFEWMNNLNIKAEADSSGYRLRLATRFHIGDTQVSTVVGMTDKPSDAYMIFRLGELSHRSIDDVIRVYRANRRKGWGVMAKQLGIKPGSREFHALKQGHDLYADNTGRHSSHGNVNARNNAGHHGNKHHGKR
jgi:hypothetical protein